MLTRIQYIFVLCLASVYHSNLQANAQNFYDDLTKQTEVETPCTCLCHNQTYLFKECSICHHHGGKFMKSPEYKASRNEQIHEEK